MKIYNYLIYRLYSFYTVDLKRLDQPLLTVSILLTIIIWYNVITIYGILRYIGIFPKYSNYTVAAITMFSFMVLNYLYIRREIFKEYGFKRDLRGGILVALYILFSIGAFFVSVNMN